MCKEEKVEKVGGYSDGEQVKVDSEDEAEVVDLTVCYEKWKGEHGVRYRTESDCEGWTPVRQKRKSRDGCIDISEETRMEYQKFGER